VHISIAKLIGMKQVKINKKVVDMASVIIPAVSVFGLVGAGVWCLYSASKKFEKIDLSFNKWF
jgi:hypothetical protein